MVPALRAQSPAMRGLDARSRREVLKAIFKERRLDDELLARVLVSHVDWFLANSLRLHVASGLFLGAGVVVAVYLVFGTLERWGIGPGVDILMLVILGLVFWLCDVVFTRRMHEGIAYRARRANTSKA